LSDRIVVINQGEILQVGTPREVYERPQSRFVADFLGQSNFFEGTITQLEGSLAQFTTDNGASLYSTRQNAAVSLTVMLE
jgi:ABC-type Fe3+/spermidine/putrescine transport system ATPase subunit